MDDHQTKETFNPEFYHLAKNLYNTRRKKKMSVEEVADKIDVPLYILASLEHHTSRFKLPLSSENRSKIENFIRLRKKRG